MIEARIRSEIEKVEKQLEIQAQELRKKYLEDRFSKHKLLKHTEEAFKTARRMDEKWPSKVERKKTRNVLFNLFWSKINKQAKLSL